MRCIFCKKNSENSVSVEHIIPESLGNIDHVLPKGIVCDACNNYFAKIEKELLEQDYFQSVRGRNNLRNKRGNLIPEIGLIHHPDGGKVGIYHEHSGISIDIPSSKMATLITSGAVNKLFIPHYEEPDPKNVSLSRFIGKVAIEALALRLINIEGWEEEIIDKPELDFLRDYVRYGPGKIKFWEYHQKRVYAESDDIIHEFGFKYPESKELFFNLTIFGIEYTINMSGPEIESYI
jgi:HNH endonuclease